MIALSSTANAFRAVEHARSIVAAVYTLQSGRLLRELENAARRGARVTVRIEGRPAADATGSLQRMNEAAVRQLQRLGADAKLVDQMDGEGAPLHLKGLVCDGAVYLDDRNFTTTGADAVVRLNTSREVADVKTAILSGIVRQSRSLQLTKADALQAEKRVLQGAKHCEAVDVESESFGIGSGVYGALKDLAQRGEHCRLIVARSAMTARTRSAIARLQNAGVDVRAAAYNEKFAVAGKRTWIGSANATTPYYDGNQLDWGITTASERIAGDLRSRFEQQWQHAKPV